MDENSDVDTVVGMLSTADLDKGQTYSYSLLDSAGGRFKIQGNFLKVRKLYNRLFCLLRLNLRWWKLSNFFPLCHGKFHS